MTDKPKRYWMGSKPTVCQVSGTIISNAFIDGATTRGPWAIMSPKAHREHGRGLGPGRGQRYEKQPDGRWLKTEG